MKHLSRASAMLVVLILIVSSTATSQQSRYEYTQDWTTRNGDVWLSNLKEFVGKPEIHALEIGCFEGRSTIWFLENVLTHPTSHITCIDPFSAGTEERFDHNLKASGLSSKVTKHKGYSQDVLRTLEYDSFDFSYIDGCHTASCVLTDAVLTWDTVKTGGVIIFGDYHWKMDRAPSERPKIAIDAFLEAFIHQVRLKHLGRHLIVQKIKGRTSDWTTTSYPRTRPNRRSP